MSNWLLIIIIVLLLPGAFVIPKLEPLMWAEVLCIAVLVVGIPVLVVAWLEGRKIN